MTRELQQTRDTCQRDIGSLKDQHDKQLHSLQEKNESNLQEMKKKGEEREGEMKEEWDKEREKMMSELKEEKEKREVMLETMQKAHSEEVCVLKGNVWSLDFTFVYSRNLGRKLKLIRIRMHNNNNVIQLQCT